MPLDPQVKAFLEKLEAMKAPSFDEIPVSEARELFLAFREYAGPPAPVAHVEDRTLPGGLKVRVYTPEGAGPRPALVYFHGGGWILGSIETIDRPCRHLARASGCVVISVDYRLAPEHKFPAAVDDAYEATRYVAEHAETFGVDPDRLAVGGDSAGGNLAAAVTLRARDRGGPRLAFQLLIYPALDFAFDTPSYRENGVGYRLTERVVRYYWGHYLARPEDGRDPLASPLRADDLRGLPPAWVLTAEFDPLRDEGEAYAERLRAAGVPAVARRYDGMVHGFFQSAGLFDRSKDALDDAAAALRAGLAS